MRCTSAAEHHWAEGSELHLTSPLKMGHLWVSSMTFSSGILSSRSPMLRVAAANG